MDGAGELSLLQDEKPGIPFILVTKDLETVDQFGGRVASIRSIMLRVNIR
jgi:hypothetical protein